MTIDSLIKFISKRFKKNTRVVLFYRNFKSFQGGHLKTWHYFNHIKKINGFSPRIFFSDTSVWEHNPWKGDKFITSNWNPESADILFLAGLDWQALEGYKLNPEQPVINLIQAVRHADPDDIRFKYLKNKAIRICVSEQVSEAIKKTGCVNGPVFTIPNGIDTNKILDITKKIVRKKNDVFISGLKNQALALQLKETLKTSGVSVDCQLEIISRKDFLIKLASAKIALLLPARTEGFYLPALEAMAVKTYVICPDAIGNRKFCKHYVNCSVPEYNFDSLYNEVHQVLSLNQDEFALRIDRAFQTAKEYSLEKEASKLKQIFLNIDNIWNSNG